MNKVFVDTSAFYALLSGTDGNHERAVKSFERLREDNAALLSTSYVLVETYALLDRRLGREAARRFREEFSPLLEIIWVSRNLHERAMDLFVGSPHSVSLVDAASFLCLRDLQIERAWAFDQHLADEGFELVE